MNAPAESAVQDAPTTLLGILKRIGPGLILTANIVGTGELVATTKLGAEVGFKLLWFLILGCFIKVFVQFELGRYTISEGVGSLQILDRLPGPRFRVRWVVWLWLLMYIGTLCQMGAMIGLVAQLFAGSDATGTYRGFAVGVAVLTAVLLVVGRYGLIEKLSTVMVVAFTLSSILAVGLLQTTTYAVTAGELAGGLAFGMPADLAAAFAAFGITGVGASELMFYPIWCLEKGYAKSVGPREDSDAWRARAKGWLRVMRYDAWLSMVVYTIGTICFYLLGAAILHRQGKLVDNVAPIQTLSGMYTSTYGPDLGGVIFFIGALMVLYSTYFVSAASNARLFVDFGGLLRLFRIDTEDARARVLRFAVIGIPAFTLILVLFVGNPVTLVLIGGTAQGLMIPFLGFAALWLRREVDPAIRGGRAWVAALVVSFVLMSTLGLYDANQKIRAVLAPAAKKP